MHTNKINATHKKAIIIVGIIIIILKIFNNKISAIIITIIINIGFVKFVDTFYNITEPGMVEVGVELIGNITFQTTFLIEVVFATATGILL